MNDEQALLAAIAANKDDDTLRLAYADHLDELGGEANQAHAEYIRIQVQHYRFPDQAWDSARESYLFCKFGHHWRRSIPGFTIPVYLRRGFPCRASATVSAVLAAINDPFARLFDEIVLGQDLGTVGLLGAIQCSVITGVEELQITSQLPTFSVIPALITNVYPRLRRLILNNLFVESHHVDKLLRASLSFPKLEELDLSHNRITDIGAETLVAHPLASRLRRLWIGNNLISDACNAKLRRHFKSVLVDVLPYPVPS